ncbi:MAG: four helix bundle protein [Oscillospiraceae bacterium]|nr:four helix bundle protein [Oscillospiraceae bacterium]
MNSDSVILIKSKAFALRIIRMYHYLTVQKHEYILSKQVLRSGTSIGANAKEAAAGQSRADFFAKHNIALKEACETEYWLELLHESGYLSDSDFAGIYSDCKELIRILTAITRKQKIASAQL